METCSVTPMWSTFGAMIAYLQTLKEKFFSNLLVPNVRRSNCLITNCARACFLIRANSPPIFFFHFRSKTCHVISWYIPKNKFYTSVNYEVLKPCANGHNIVGQPLPSLLDVTSCVRVHTLLHVVAFCWELFPKAWKRWYVQTDATTLNTWANNVASVYTGL